MLFCCVVVCAVIFASMAFARVSWAACGNGVVESNEECDPGGGLYIDGNLALGTCTSGTNCFYALSCCKFNCQFVGQGATCFDGNTCTTNDVCNQIGGCDGNDLPAGSACTDGLFCTAVDQCNASGTCIGTGDPCAGGTECADRCNEAADSCNDPNGTTCGSSLSNDCTDPDTCNGAGACSANDASLGTPAVTTCGDGNACTADLCDGTGGCAHPAQFAGAPCGDPTDTGCANPDSCNGLGSCVGNDEPVGTACGDPADDTCRNPDVCDGAGECSSADEPAGTPCGSAVGNECTDPDTCDAGGNCAANDAPAGAPAASTCDDQNDCTADECDGAGACAHPSRAAGTPCGDPTTDDCTAPDTCSGSGACDANHAADGQSCDDDDACTSDGSCAAGACVAGSAVVCDDGQPCTYDHCDSLSGQCVFDDEPRPDCLPTLDAQIKVANRANDLNDKLKWLWKRTPDFLPEGLLANGLGDPGSGTDYTLCIFDGRGGESTLVAQLDVPAGLTWQLKRPGFFKYIDRTRANDGVFRGALRAGVKGALGFAAGGVNLPLPSPASGDHYFEMMPSLTTQLSSGEGACWIADFIAAKVNGGDTFKTTRKAVVIPH